ncbi:histidine kinase [Microbacterium betulae]|uniref:histidine kinase n=1 Tax=Microbacterium betulae TaxID=2981139 RepID=A0AA97FIY7_9MICO|nr:histidine kinase [Microbacterium sp. AB]WOF22884.1 histidine kinase [Microbacterium sp. AB]
MTESPRSRPLRQLVRLVEGRRGPRPRTLMIRGWIALVAGAVVLFWVSVPSLVVDYDLALPVAFLLASVQCVTLPLAVRLPRCAMIVHVVGIMLIGWLTRGSLEDDFWPVPVPNLLALTAILIVLGLREEWIVSVSAWWLSFLAMTVVVVLSDGDLTSLSEWGVDVMVSVTVTLIALAVSITVGQRGRVRRIIADAKRDVELEQARRAAVEERARIARELHDVVAHSMSIVHIQAESARYRVADLPAAQGEFTDIARSARAALGEMRQLLAALHPEDEKAFYAPQPTVADIPDLIRSTEKVGSPVAFSSDVEPGAVSPLVELTAYRIVQEALSNVIRHAPHAAVQVTLRRGPLALDVRIRNDPPPPSDAPARRIAETGGHGLRGMRERVALLKGEVEQRPLENGGYLVAARLPTTAGEESE